MVVGIINGINIIIELLAAAVYTSYRDHPILVFCFLPHDTYGITITYTRSLIAPFVLDQKLLTPKVAILGPLCEV